MDVALGQLAARQGDLVAAWQLFALDWTRSMVDHRVKKHGWRVIHQGVYALGRAPLTREQRWIAATLTTPDTFLSRGSAGARYGIWRFDRRYETVTRAGTGGPRRIGGLMVYRSRTLKGDRVIHRGLRMTTPERTVIDLAAECRTDRAARRVMREALRLNLTKPLRLVAAASRHATRHRAPLIAQTASRYVDLPYDRTRSDPEAYGLELLHDAGVELPLVNAMVAGEEADYTWLERKRIIEIDGPQYHRFADEDARKQAVWEDAGFDVRRIPSDDVYFKPARLVALAA